MSDTFYTIYNLNKNTYLHYDPFDEVYFTSNEILGAVAWTKVKGTKFISDNLDNEWSLKYYKSAKFVKINNTQIEKNIYSQTH